MTGVCTVIVWRLQTQLPREASWSPAWSQEERQGLPGEFRPGPLNLAPLCWDPARPAPHSPRRSGRRGTNSFPLFFSFIFCRSQPPSSLINTQQLNLFPKV